MERSGSGELELLVKGDPTRSILDTRKIIGIWKLGTPVDRAALKGTWEKALEEYQKKNAQH